MRSADRSAGGGGELQWELCSAGPGSNRHKGPLASLSANAVMNVGGFKWISCCRNAELKVVSFPVFRTAVSAVQCA